MIATAICSPPRYSIAQTKRVDISDDDNNWAGNNPSVVTSYWGLRATYDYFNLIHNRRSYDGKNGNMTIFNDPNMDNSGHNARGGGGTIRIGLANPGDNDDYNTLDIIGHEFTHSVIEQTRQPHSGRNERIERVERIVLRHLRSND